MRLAVVVLILLGLLAAGAAVVLFQAMQETQTGPEESPTVTVLVATDDLKAMTVLRANHVEEIEAPRKGLPQGYLTSQVQAAGRVLSVGVVKGQILSQDCFISQGNIAAFSTVIPSGMRAFSIALSSRQVVGGWIYPGCTVDILAAFRLPSSANADALSTTLLQNLQVMAIEGDSVITQNDPEEDTAKRRTSRGNVVVTLLVDSKQASALQLATEYGAVAVAMRNPLDQDRISSEGVKLSRGRLAGEALDPAALTRHLTDMLTREVAQVANAGSDQPTDTTKPSDSVSTPTAPSSVQPVKTQTFTPASPVSNSDRAYQPRSTWGVTVIRGQTVELAEFDATAE